jgi:hypothetical protein
VVSTQAYYGQKLFALSWFGNRGNTGVIGAGGLAPIAYGVIADHSNRTVGIVAAALTAALTIPLILALKPILENEHSRSAKQ